MNSFDVSSFLTSQMWSLPYVVIYLAGITLAIAFWRRHPMVSLLALAGFAVLLGNIVIAVALQYWAMNADSADMGRIFTIAGAFRSICGALGFGLLIGAIFGWRSAEYAPGQYH